jgi:dTDP-4-dehydrorhamnose reductase
VRLLVTGAGGTLGGALALALARRFEVVAARHRAATPAGLPPVPLELESREALASALAATRPDAVVHAAAIADVDLCEREPERARKVNTLASQLVARACAERGLALVLISTDLVFDGARPFVSEQDAPRPLSVYGNSKLEAERVVLAAHATSAIARVPLVVGAGHGPRATASEAIAWTVAAGQRARLFRDQFRAPLDAESLADGIGRVLQRRAQGIFHFGGPERVSRYALGLRVAALLGLPASLLDPITRAERPSPGPRPDDVCLGSARARHELDWQPRTLDAMILAGRRAPDIIPAG